MALTGDDAQHASSNDVDTVALGVTLINVVGAHPGPTLALLGGVHGDKDEGVLAVGRVLHQLAEVPIIGSLTAVARANPRAWAAAARIDKRDDVLEPGRPNRDGLNRDRGRA